MNYKETYEKVGTVTGWDFSKIEKRTKIIGEKWDFLEVVGKYVNNETVLLDIGTGGGEKLLKVGRFAKRAYGIDNSESMIATAKKDLAESRMTNVEFKLADAKKLPFHREFFDLVMCRHAPFYADEVFRVLKEQGVFLTQQVAENDKQNIKDIFGRGQSFGVRPGTHLKGYVKGLKMAGFDIEREDTYDAEEYYADMADLIFLLRNTPIVPDFDVEQDKKFLDEIEKHKTRNGIKTNSARFLIICRKIGKHKS